MDPSIIRLLEDDEDESMHSGADVEAFTAALNRDIEGNNSSLNQPFDSESRALSKGSNSPSQHQYGHWQASDQGNSLPQQIQHHGEKLHISQRESSHHVSGSDNQCCPESHLEHDKKQFLPEKMSIDQQLQSAANPLQFVDNKQIKFSEQNSSHFPPTLEGARHPVSQKNKEQQFNNQQRAAAPQLNNSIQWITPASIPFQQMIQNLQPHVDKDRYMQLQAVFSKLKSQEMTKENFLRVCKSIVGDQMIRQAVQQVQMQVHVPAGRPINMNQLSQIQVPSHQSQIQGSTGQIQADASISNIDTNAQTPQEIENKRELQTARKLLQQMQFPPASFSMYGSTSSFRSHAYPNPSQVRQPTFTQGVSSTKSGGSEPMTMVNIPRCELQNASNEKKRLQAGTVSHSTSQHQIPISWQSTNIPNKDQRTSSSPSISHVKQELFDQDSQPSLKPYFIVSQSLSISSVHTVQGNPNIVPVKYEKQEGKTAKFGFSESTSLSAPPPVSRPSAIQAGPTAQMQVRNLSATVAGTSPPNKPVTGHKKPLEFQGSSQLQASKKQKPSGSGALLDQSIEQLNDVTAVSGVNLREEEEQLLSAPKEDSRASEATRKFVQEEEDRLILQKEPLQNKLMEIMSKCGIEGMGDNVERCLSVCVEERLQGLINDMIRFSKQRIDIEKSRHQFVITSDIERQIVAMNQKAKEEREKNQAGEAEKLCNYNDAEVNVGQDADKDEGRSKTQKINKEEDDKMRTTAANVAARAAVGGDDMLSKWQLMAEQARQKREGIVDGPFGCQHGRTSAKLLTNVGSTSRGQGARKKGTSASMSGGMRMHGRRPGAMSHPEIERILSTKDLIATLEREPQMSKSTLIFRLYEKMGSAQ
ncbi:uncharacterized protein A4U43_C07F29340 [Asparagus officinalis]|uniref:RST domain-containing protein n=1 Tax=Asparagus officinalis TaxID=4686 RepID=A0A5P1EFR1_ASPOF|nr:transcription initiation factor TFIID subunit 4b-like [Asparagus officinalis]ONK64736.1 uncharacterized protein A4U43_C07F29340 [Asparagus officinalis]